MPAYSIYNLSSGEELHPFFEQFLFSEDAAGVARLHKTANDYGITLPKEITFDYYENEFLPALGIKAYTEYLKIRKAVDASQRKVVVGYLPVAFKIRNPKLLKGYIGDVIIFGREDRDYFRSQSYIHKLELTQITSFGNTKRGSHALRLDVSGDVYIYSEGESDFSLPCLITASSETIFDSTIIPKHYDDIVGIDMLKFYSDIKVYENVLTYPVIRKQDFSKVKQQATEIAKILEMPCMRGCSVVGNTFKNEKGRYCYSFTREELHRLLELRNSSECCPIDVVFSNKWVRSLTILPALEAVYGKTLILNWIEHLVEDGKVFYEDAIDGNTYIKPAEYTYELLLSDISYIAENLQPLYGFIKLCAATPQNYRQKSARAIKAYECTQV